ncbi:MAG: shikimate kinase [Duncaniella sp.]|uniref:shikimate kinase n=1 Tax=Duncaniella sp. TaxID=2518496 RepID=UPI0023C762FC|nr:shikimate kinase [Duncaniella sp.]MDE6090305.1 shikimate kinase [Duncaniella sp.]
MKAIFLIGYMGSGKSTLGKALAQRCDISFIDLDDYIEERAGKKIREIFAEDGEAAFRDLERRMLLEISDMDNVLVACGGGTPCFGDNMALMNSRGITVLLQTSHERLFERLKRGRHKRPLIASLTDEELDGFITEQLARRMVHYGKSAEVFDSTLLEDENQVETKCEAFIDRFNLPRKK